MNHDVIVIGAGPVGATAALLLARSGLRVGLVEGRSAPSSRLGAVSVDDEALRIWQSCGLEEVISPLWESGSPGEPMCTYRNDRGKPFLTLRQSVSDLGYPHAVVIHQASLLRALWAEIDRTPAIYFSTGAELTGLSQCASGVRVCLKDILGNVSEHGAPWIVACDGSRSMARELAGIHMPMQELPGRWLVADIEDDANLSMVDIRCSTSGTAVTVPLPGGMRRIEIRLPDGDNIDCLNDEHSVRLKLKEFWPKVSEARILDHSILRFSAAIADRWRAGRVFVAGDAAHVMPPFAGQGLGMGLRDVANLCFKLAGVCQGWLDEEVLDSYEQERLPHQQRVLKLTLRLGKLMTPTSRWRSALEQRFVRVLSECEPVRRRLEMRGPGLRPAYRKGFLGEGSRTGRYLPQPSVSTPCGITRIDELLGPRMTWIAIGNGQSPGDPSRLGLGPGDTLLVEGHDFVDPDHSLQRTFGAGSSLLVRPDRIIHTHIAQKRWPAVLSRRTPWHAPRIQHA